MKFKSPPLLTRMEVNLSEKEPELNSSKKTIMLFGGLTCCSARTGGTQMTKYKQMNLEVRITIERGLDNRESFKYIASLIDKDCITISKEVRSHLIYKKSGAYVRPFNNCVNRTLEKHTYDVIYTQNE